MEEAKVGQVEQAAAVEVVLVQHQHLRPGSGLPVEGGREGHGLAHLNPGLEYDHQMPGGGGEVVDVRGARQGDDAGVLERAIGGQTPDDGLGPVHAEVPDATVRLDPGVGEEGHALQVVPQGDEALGLQRAGIHRHGGARFPQGPDIVAHLEHGGIGGIGVVVRADLGPRIGRGAEAGHDHGVQPGFLTALGRIGKAGSQRRLAIRDAEFADQAIAVEPVLGRAAGAAELGRAVAIEGALEPRRCPAVDPGQTVGRDVALEVPGHQSPVCGCGILGGQQAGGLGHIGGEDAAAHGGSTQQEGSAGRDHGQAPASRVRISAG